ncbi:MAG: cbb3-type cytochrome c oxidase N-terminal domain-containing protein [Persicimonas sp.]
MSSASNQPESKSGGDSAYPDKLLDHDYDGIKEYDNPMPGWWLWLFYGSIAWAFVYFVGISLDFLPDYEDKLEAGQAELEELRHESGGGGGGEVDVDAIVEGTEDDEVLATGEEVYKKECASCHASDGGGDVGPNLTDKHWIHGGSPADIYDTIASGVSDAGMPSWEGPLNGDELVAVAAYVRSLQGTDPPDAKGPEGEEYEGE